MAHSSTSASAPAGPHSLPANNIAAHDHEKPKQQEYASIIRPQRAEQQDALQLQRTISSISHHDMAHVTYTPTGDNDTVYDKFSPHRKHIIVAVVSFCSFLAPVSSTTVLSAVPEVAATFSTDGSIVNISNALYMCKFYLTG